MNRFLITALFLLLPTVSALAEDPVWLPTKISAIEYRIAADAGRWYAEGMWAAATEKRDDSNFAREGCYDTNYRDAGDNFSDQGDNQGLIGTSLYDISYNLYVTAEQHKNTALGLELTDPNKASEEYQKAKDHYALALNSWVLCKSTFFEAGRLFIKAQMEYEKGQNVPPLET